MLYVIVKHNNSLKHHHLVRVMNCSSNIHRVIGMSLVPESRNFLAGHTDVGAVADFASKGAGRVKGGIDALVHAHADTQVPL